jgi:hypothetical protein
MVPNRQPSRAFQAPLAKPAPPIRAHRARSNSASRRQVGRPCGACSACSGWRPSRRRDGPSPPPDRYGPRQLCDVAAASVA